MLYREIIAVCSETHTEHINTLCGLNVELLNVKPGGTYRVTQKNGNFWKTQQKLKKSKKKKLLTEIEPLQLAF